MQDISSVKNPIIKKVMALNKKRGRTQHGQFLVEGIREIEMALESGLQPAEVLFNDLWAPNDLDQFSSRLEKSRTYKLTNEVFERISYRGSVPNALGIFSLLNTDIDHLQLPDESLVLVLEAIQKPGNMGAIFRTADAAGVDAVFIVNSDTDFYNPNVIRASLGTVFTIPIVICSNEDCLSFLNEKDFKVYGTYLEGARPHYDVDMTGNTALVMGSEAFGITGFWIDNSQHIKIPMRGKADSMNVSTATSVVVYEAVRQRLS